MKSSSNDKISDFLKIDQNINDLKLSSSSIIQTEVLDTRSISKLSYNTFKSTSRKSCTLNLENIFKKPQYKIAIDFLETDIYQSFYKKQNHLAKIRKEKNFQNQLCKCNVNFSPKKTEFGYNQNILMSLMVFLIVILITFILNFFQASLNL